MKRKGILSLVLAAAMLFILSGCAVTPQAEPTPTATEAVAAPAPTQEATPVPQQPVEFSAKVIRADGMTEDVEYPMVTRIQSPGELTDYLNIYGSVYQFDVAYDAGESFIDAVTSYDDPYFNDHELILVAMQETSGSNQLKVVSLTSDTDKAVLTVERRIAEVGTTDMAQWQIIVEVESGVLPATIDVVVQDVSE